MAANRFQRAVPWLEPAPGPANGTRARLPVRPRRALGRAVLAALGVLAMAAPALADTSNVTAAGFTSSFRAEVKASPDEVWKAIVQLPRWWSDAHTWSGKASNMTLELRAGGCWCERWGDGQSAMHGQVVLVQPGRVLRLFGNLGPLLEMPATGVLTIVTSAQDGKTFLRMSYRVGGPAELALDQLAPAVDQVMGQQYQRLKALVESGNPD